MPKIVGTIDPSPLPPQFNGEISSYQSGEATQLCAAGGGGGGGWGGGLGGGGIISSSYMISSVREWSTEFVVRVLFVSWLRGNVQTNFDQDCSLAFGQPVL